MDLQIVTNRQQLHKVQSGAFSLQYSPFRLLNIKYTESSARSKQEDIITNQVNQVEDASVFTKQEPLRTITHENKKKQHYTKVVKVLQIDLQRRTKGTKKENYNQKLKKELVKLDQEIKVLSMK